MGFPSTWCVEFWGKLDRKYWAGLDPYPDGMALLREAERQVGPENICILTNPGELSPGVVEGKRDWIDRHLPEYKKRVIFGSAKQFLAGPDRLLVDDYDGNVDGFRSHRGWAIQVPRPWNRRKESTVDGASFDVPALSRELVEVLRQMG
jgi:hypothetical protein